VHLLLVEDDERLRLLLTRLLSEQRHVVDAVGSGAEALAMLEMGEGIDVVVLDIGLPDMSGLDVARRVRSAGTDVAILMLTARDTVDDRVRGLDVGADDYLVKPFAFAELHARLEALMRRGVGETPETKLRVGDLEMNLLTREVTRARRHIHIQPREFRLLEYLMRHEGQVVTRTMLLENVWDYHFDPQTNVIDVHVSRLRAKIDKEFDEPLLQTVRGAGYVLRAPG
jgi:two-component system OmpR family response regulator